MEVHPLLHQLDSLLAGEVSRPRPGAPVSGQATISPGMRDGSAHVLRCLKVWYDLPSDVFHTALANIDTFLAKMKAQPKHLSCIAVSSFHLACSQLEDQLLAIPEPADLVSISQSRCSASDLLRMEAILATKLDNKQQQAVPPLPVTPLSFLRLMMAVSRAAAARLDISPVPPAAPPPHLLHQLEILVCDSSTLKFRPCEVALALLCTEFQRTCSDHPDTAPALMGFVSELQKYCGVSGAEFCSVLGSVAAILDKYNAAGQVPHRQRLVWKLSNRTLKQLRPTDRLRPTLPRICEESDGGHAASRGRGGMSRLRSASECSLESVESDSDAGLHAAGAASSSDPESDIEMEEPRTWARIVAAS